MKTFISNKQQSEAGYENQLINKLGKEEIPSAGPFNTAMADALQKALAEKYGNGIKIKSPRQNVFHLVKEN